MKPMQPAAMRLCSAGGVRAAACLAALLAGAFASLASAAEPTLSREQIEGLITRLQANGQQWFADEPVDPAVDRDLKAVVFDEPSAPLVAAAIRAIKLQQDPALYAADRLLRQVLMAKTEVVLAVLPAVKGVHAQVKNDYRKFEHYSGGKTAAPALPASAPAGEPRKRPLTHLDRDQLVARHNELVHALELKAFQAMMRAGDSRDDDQLVEWMLQEEKRGSLIYEDILGVISTAATKMQQKRAEHLYDVLNRAGDHLRLQPAREYVHPARCKVEASAQSTFETKTANAGVEITTALNRVATAAKRPAIRVPTKKELDEANNPKKRKN